jgi:hypothetical protein
VCTQSITGQGVEGEEDLSTGLMEEEDVNKEDTDV